jgi:ribonucleotide reductase alpha subunit
VLAGRGLNERGHKVVYSNCFVITPPEDNIESIFDTAKKMARTYSMGGGCGTNLGNLRPNGAKVNNSAESTSGAVSFMDLYSMTTGLIGMKGRRGALMLTMPVEHPDIMEFINVKNDLTKVTKANISVMVSDDFMLAVQNNEDWEMKFETETGEVISKVIPAREIFREIAQSSWNTGEPAILYWDRVQDWHLNSENPNFKYVSTNPCLVGDTLIQTVEGNIPIKELVGKKPFVYAMGEDGKLTIKQAEKVWLTRKNAELVKVVTGKGEITCTPDHKIFTTNRGWVEAQDLKKGDKVKGLNRSTAGHRHVKVGLSGTGYEKEHQFVARHFMDIEGFDIHHKNDDGFDNRLSNLETISHSEHSRLSNTGRKIEVERDEFGRYVEKEVKTKRKNRNLNKRVGVNWFVYEVVKLNYTEDVYDMTIPEVHNFIANNMVVHNCGEKPLPSGGSCMLASFNLSEYVIDPFTDNAHFDLDGFLADIPEVVRFMDDLLEEGIKYLPLEEQRKSAEDYRQLGIGVMGLADMLIKLGIEYGSNKSLDIIEHLMQFLATRSIIASAKLAEERGSYKAFNAEKVLQSPYLMNLSTIYGDAWYAISKYGLRNAELLSIAPTGSLSSMWNISGGVEPIFATHYTRKSESLGEDGEPVYYNVYTGIVEEYMKKFELSDVSELPDYFVTAMELDPSRRIAVQSVMQDYVDSAISSTINLPEETTVEEIEDIYMKAWEHGLKGVTIFRDGCSRGGILTVEKPKDKPKENPAECST